MRRKIRLTGNTYQTIIHSAQIVTLTVAIIGQYCHLLTPLVTPIVLILFPVFLFSVVGYSSTTHRKKWKQM